MICFLLFRKEEDREDEEGRQRERGGGGRGWEMERVGGRRKEGGRKRKKEKDYTILINILISQNILVNYCFIYTFKSDILIYFNMIHIY